MILDVKLHYFGNLGLVYYSYNQETYRFFRRLSSGCTVQRQWRSKRGVAKVKVGVVDENFRALRAHDNKNPPSQYPASAPEYTSYKSMSALHLRILQCCHLDAPVQYSLASQPSS